MSIKVSATGCTCTVTIFLKLKLKLLCWSRDNAFVSVAGGLRFNLLPIKSDSVLPTVRLRCDISLKGAVLPTGAMLRKWAPQTRCTLLRNTANIIKDLILI